MEAVLTTLAREALRWLPDEPWLHRKRVLAEHVLDDLELAAAFAGASAPAVVAAAARRLEEATDAVSFERLAYGEVKPLVAAAARAQIPGAPEAALRVLVPLALRQERHVDELPQGLTPLSAALDADPVVFWGELDPGIAGEVAAADDAARAGDARAAAERLSRASALEAAALRARRQTT